MNFNKLFTLKNLNLFHKIYIISFVPCIGILTLIFINGYRTFETYDNYQNTLNIVEFLQNSSPLIHYTQNERDHSLLLPNKTTSIEAETKLQVYKIKVDQYKSNTNYYDLNKNLKSFIHSELAEFKIDLNNARNENLVSNNYGIVFEKYTHAISHLLNIQFALSKKAIIAEFEKKILSLSVLTLGLEHLGQLRGESALFLYKKNLVNFTNIDTMHDLTIKAQSLLENTAIDITYETEKNFRDIINSSDWKKIKLDIEELQKNFNAKSYKVDPYDFFQRITRLQDAIYSIKTYELSVIKEKIVKIKTKLFHEVIIISIICFSLIVFILFTTSHFIKVAKLLFVDQGKI